MSESVKVERNGPVTTVLLHRPQARNAVDRATATALAEAFLAFEADADAAVAVFAGEGGAFCAGADLKERQGMSENDIRVQVELYRSELGPLDRSPKPVIAAINGVAFGGGLELALVCDLRVAAAHAQVGLPETTLGIIPGAGGTQRVGRIVGDARAKEMILLGRRLGAAEALAWGLVNRVTPAGTDLIEDTLAFIEPIANGAPLAQAAALEAIDRSFDVGLELGMELEKVSYDKVLVSADRREALAAFAEKRKPVFKGC